MNNLVKGPTSILCGAILFAGVSSAANADITATSAEVSMRIDAGGVTEVSGSDSGATFASVDLLGPASGMEVAALLDINDLTSDTANLSFDFVLNGNGYSGTGYLGADGPNRAYIDYHAYIDSELEYAWNFDYLGPNPFGLQVIFVFANGELLGTLGNVGIPGHHEGQGTFDLIAGNDYTIRVDFVPNVSGGVGSIDGELVGDISFDFNEFVTVPIDIKFCSDPNAFNCKKNGVLPVTIFGTEDFLVEDIDPSTLRLCTQDMVCTGAPRDYSYADRGDPLLDLGVAMCAIDPDTEEELDWTENQDIYLDLDAAFEASEVKDILGDYCDDAAKGEVSEALVVIGETYDGVPIYSVPADDNTGIDRLVKANK